MPKRIQMSRQHPWRQQFPDAVKVDRTTKWGNPFTVSEYGRATATKMYREAVYHGDLEFTADDVRRELAGKDLACWCRLDQQCHADVLLEVADSGDDR